MGKILLMIFILSLLIEKSERLELQIEYLVNQIDSCDNRIKSHKQSSKQGDKTSKKDSSFSKRGLNSTYSKSNILDISELKEEKFVHMKLTPKLMELIRTVKHTCSLMNKALKEGEGINVQPLDDIVKLVNEKNDTRPIEMMIEKLNACVEFLNINLEEYIGWKLAQSEEEKSKLEYILGQITDKNQELIEKEEALKEASDVYNRVIFTSRFLWTDC